MSAEVLADRFPQRGLHVGDVVCLLNQEKGHHGDNSRDEHKFITDISKSMGRNIFVAEGAKFFWKN